MDKLTGDGRVHQETGSSHSRVTTQRQDRFLVFLSRRTHISTARALEINFRRAAEVHLPDQTVRNRLNGDCTRARRPARSQVLTEEHRAVRINFAREHQNRHLRLSKPVEMTTFLLTQLMIDLLGCVDVREDDTQIVRLSNLTGSMGARRGLR